MQCVSSCSLNCTEHFIYVLKTRHLVVIDISFNCIQHFSNLKIHNNKGFSYKGESKFKLEYLVFTLIVHVGCQLSCQLENLYFVSKVLFWKKFFLVLLLLLE